MTTPNTPHDSFHLVGQELLRELIGARCELRAIAESNARLVALLERSVLSDGESVRVEDSLNRSWPEDLADALGLSEETRGAVE